ncbi:hypothetical protein PICMEDRAFT_77608 [Pichia membranifaciens NRRL Y-2026]|uniref:Class II aldolase/adducin N-terminal domain-containing protein n=1 Tax=Pichia membranifaciens NRRL Y-2026 TaxID=763406 RepID=A0A1E3NKC0_9ASCO|nr:hypothetical protein PICMEDRAFT_77608 [Pichia membranifaciens NRRL Y-2026]ODQ46569.1 hypothetical protein PICMEDRAFT_77608 [Pichia membranifaciens NRRL Y-2026]
MADPFSTFSVDEDFLDAPKFDNSYREREWILEHMAGAFRVLGSKDISEGLSGHISVKDPVDNNAFWINPLGLHYSMIKASDLVLYNENGDAIGGNPSGRISKPACQILAVVHKLRNAKVICHNHSPYGKAYSCFGKKLEMINQDVCFFYRVHNFYEAPKNVSGLEDIGRSIFERLGENGRALILQNHGLITIGSTVDEAAYLFLLLEKSCKIQLLVNSAANHGISKKLMDDAEAEANFKKSDSDSLYKAFQPDFQYQVSRDDSFLSFSKSK